MHFLISFMLAASFCASLGLAQSRSFDYIKRMDTNNNGYIEPQEISDRSRSYLERFASAAGINMSRPNSVSRWEYAARKYYENRDVQSTASKNIAKLPGIEGFGEQANKELLPSFGAAIKYPYTAEDLENADRMLRRYDSNKDGELDRSEARDAPWTKGNPFDFDFNNDGRISRLEMAQRYARIRMTENTKTSQRYSPLGNQLSTSSSSNGDVAFRRARSKSESNSSSRYLAASIMRRNDRNRDGKLDLQERAGLGINDGEADLDFDGLISQEELDTWYYRQMKASVNDLSGVLPTWFFERDANGDQQIDMAEFADEWNTEKVAEFQAFDTNGDGILTAEELLSAQAIIGGTFSSQTAVILVPNSTIVNEIEVNEDLIIGDLNVQLSITHTYNEQLDAFLTGPDGQRIELFSGVGRSDDNFEDTIFDDEAREHIRQGRAPFRGSYRPQAVEKRQTSLSHYKGKNVKGVWQLMIRGSRSDRFGVFHGWSLIVKPQDEFAAQSLE